MSTLPESLTTAALLGTARSAPEFGALHTAGAAGELAGDPAATLLYQVPADSVQLAAYAPAHAFKASFDRPTPSGAVGDTHV